MCGKVAVGRKVWGCCNQLCYALISHGLFSACWLVPGGVQVLHLVLGSIVLGGTAYIDWAGV
jgi:hypothetical protein